jgi:hypothetical protein
MKELALQLILPTQNLRFSLVLAIHQKEYVTDLLELTLKRGA